MPTITAYAPTDVSSVSVGSGCGSQHEVVDAPTGGRGITCPVCSVELLRTPSLGWAGTPHGVKLTVDEKAALEEAKATGLTAQSLAAKAIGEKIAELVLAGKPAQEPVAPQVSKDQVIGVMKDLPQEQLAELLKLAGLTPAEDEKPRTTRRSK